MAKREKIIRGIAGVSNIAARLAGKGGRYRDPKEELSKSKAAEVARAASGDKGSGKKGTRKISLKGSYKQSYNVRSGWLRRKKTKERTLSASGEHEGRFSSGAENILGGESYVRAKRGHDAETYSLFGIKEHKAYSEEDSALAEDYFINLVDFNSLWDNAWEDALSSQDPMLTYSSENTGYVGNREKVYKGHGGKSTVENLTKNVLSLGIGLSDTLGEDAEFESFDVIRALREAEAAFGRNATSQGILADTVEEGRGLTEQARLDIASSRSQAAATGFLSSNFSQGTSLGDFEREKRKEALQTLSRTILGGTNAAREQTARDDHARYVQERQEKEAEAEKSNAFTTAVFTAAGTVAGFVATGGTAQGASAGGAIGAGASKL